MTRLRDIDPAWIEQRHRREWIHGGVVSEYLDLLEHAVAALREIAGCPGWSFAHAIAKEALDAEVGGG